MKKIMFILKILIIFLIVFMFSIVSVLASDDDDEFNKINEGNYKPDESGKCSETIDYRCTGDYILNEKGIVEFTCIE